jgi:Na+/phosphate symporter
MKTNRNILAVFAVIIICSVLVWLSATLQGDQKTYEIQPHLTIPEYKTDLARVMDAYERLMERYMDLTEQNQSMVGTDLKYVVTTLDSIDGRLAEFSARIARIETALGIEQPRSSLGPKPDRQP